jgi:hypothetical protein
MEEGLMAVYNKGLIEALKATRKSNGKSLNTELASLHQIRPEEALF